MKVPYTNFQKQFRENAEYTMIQIGNVLDKGDMILGEELETFEEEFSNYVGAKHAIGVANGTDSLIILYRALGITSGDEVITAPNSWISSASSIALVGAKPVFADVSDDQLISPEAIELVITRRTKAIVPAHLTGKMCDMKEILRIADHHGIAVIEDAAQCIGSGIKGLGAAGSLGLASSFSMHPLKNLNSIGDAGIITTNDDKLAAKLRLLRNHGLKDRDAIECWGYNSRLDTIAAAVLRLRIRELPKIIDRRCYLAGCYDELLDGVEQISTPASLFSNHTYHTYTIQCERRDELKDYLAEHDIESKIHYPIPIHLQPAAKDLNYQPGDFPNAEYQAKRILSLPINQYLTKDQVEYVAQTIVDFYTT